MTIHIYTSNVGEYDPPRNQQGVITHNPQPHNGEHPRMTAKRAKLLESLPLGFRDADYLIWIDASMVLTQSPRRIRDELAFLCGDAPFAVWRHPFRNDAIKEAVFSVEHHPQKYGHNVFLQAVHYAEEGLPNPSGLYACGLVVWNMKNPLTAQIADFWLDECERFSYQDQVSLPYVLWRMDIKPALLIHELYRNPWFTICPHPRDD